MDFSDSNPPKRNAKSLERLSSQRVSSNNQADYQIPSDRIYKRDKQPKNNRQSPTTKATKEEKEEYKLGDENRPERKEQRLVDHDIQMQCLYEEFLDLNKPNSHFPTEGHLKGFLQQYKEFFPNGIGDPQPNLQALNHPEIKTYLEQRPSSYRVRKTSKVPVKSVLENEPHIKITVLRANFNNNVVMEYFVTPRGMVNSTRNTDHDDIMIGRQQAAPEGVIPNDICLFYSDRTISRIHCKIITKYGFQVARKIPEYFLAFLMMSHKRLGATSPGYKVPEGLYRHIYSFIKEPRKFWLVDLGSSFGTYVKLKSELIYPLERGQTFLVGLDTLFNVIDVRSVISKDAYTNSDGEDIKIGEQEDFLKFLFQEKLFNKCEIHGLTELESDRLDLMISTHKEFLYGEDTSYIETERSFHSFKRPYIKIEIQNQVNTHPNPNHIIVGNPQKEFVIGRTQECDVNLIHNTAISRKQCRFVYHENNWYIADGIQAKKSANGTWISLTDYRLKRERIESEPRLIENGTEIKISDAILQIEILNND